MRFTKWDALGILAAGAVGAALFFGLYNKVLPEASVELKLSKAQAVAKTKGLFWKPGYKVAATFSADDQASVYLQKNLGVERANSLSKDTVPVWFWRVRLFKPLQKEEFVARWSPTGRLVGFKHALPEDAPGDTLSEAEALAVAKHFLDSLGFNLDDWELVKASYEDKKARRDHYFTWRSKSKRWGEADLRVDITVAGSEVAAFKEYLKVPEAFTRSYKAERSVGSLLQTIAQLLAILMVIWGFVMFIIRARRGGNDLKLGALIGGALGLSLLISQPLLMPLLLERYDTSLQFSSYMATVLTSIALAALVIGLFVALATAFAGGSLDKQELLWGIRPLSRGRLSRDLWKPALLAYPLAFGFMGYQALVYWLGVKFLGVWSPASTGYTTVYMASVPALFALLASLQAGLMEESVFRFFGYALLKPYLRNTLLAFLIPTIIWAFLHSTYEVFPVYFRGIELTVGGLLFAFVFWRWGLITAVLTHFAVDLIYFTIPLLKAPFAELKVTGALAVSAIALFGLIALLGKPEETLREKPAALKPQDVLPQFLLEHPEALDELLVRAGVQGPRERLRWVAELLGYKVKVKKEEIWVKAPEEAAAALERTSGLKPERQGDWFKFRF